MAKLSEFRENPENPSAATDSEIERLAGKLKRVPLGLVAMRIAYVTDAEGGGKMVISGNKRLRCLKMAYGEDGEVPDEWFADVTAMSEAERHEFILDANISDGHWDLERLLAQYDKSELTDAMGENEASKLLEQWLIEHGDDESGQTDADAIPETQHDAVSRRGCVYQLGRHRLMCGDSTSADDVSRLFDGAHARMLFTSPPYADLREYNGDKDLSVGNVCSFITTWRDFADYECINLGIIIRQKEIVQYWDEYIEKAHNAGLKLLAWNVWDKGGATSIGQQKHFFPTQHEWIFVFGADTYELYRTKSKLENKRSRRVTPRRQPDGTMELSSVGDISHHLKRMGSVLSVFAETGSIRKEHPATFPVGLPSEYIKAMTDEGDVVCDSFGGSGTTIIAAEQLGRVCYSMELDEHYCDVIRRRWAEFVHGEGCDWQSLTPECESVS